MNTPGRCTNTEFCWVGNSGRTVHVLLGADFVCPACNGPLRPPSVSRTQTGPTVRKAALATKACSRCPCRMWRHGLARRAGPWPHSWPRGLGNGTLSQTS
jgi:hypothetical protein